MIVELANVIMMSSQDENIEGSNVPKYTLTGSSYRKEKTSTSKIETHRVSAGGNIHLPYIQRSELGPGAFHSENVLP